MVSLRDMINLASATEIVDFSAVRRSLPLAYIMEVHGHPVEESSGKLRARCPFHEDSSPSFSIFGDGLEHWNCWSCDTKGGDAIDLLCKFEPELKENGKVGAAVFKRVRELITELIDAGWTGPQGGLKAQPFDVDSAQEVVDSAVAEVDYERVEEFIEFKRNQRGFEAWPYGSEYLVDSWGVGTYGSWLILPYWNEDSNLISYKWWSDPNRRRMTHGAGIWGGHLYGEWREDTGDPVLLVEGESDAWYAHYHVGQSFRVLGLPTGAGTNPSTVDKFADRDVYIAFDNDVSKDGNPGRAGTKRWAEALEKAGANVRVVPIPADRDLSTAGNIVELLQQARPLVPPPVGVEPRLAGYVSVSKKGEESGISNWTFVPDKELSGDGMLAFEGHIRPGGASAVLRSEDLATSAKLTAWAAAHGRSWYGSDKDSRVLMGLLQAEGVYLPHNDLVTVAGLHDGTFIWPGGQIGGHSKVYVPPVNDIGLKDTLSIRPGAWGTEEIHSALAMQDFKVTCPLLAWMAVAPIRSLMNQFPFVFVTGARGSGKTQTLEAVIAWFSGSRTQRTFESTPHAFGSLFGASNAFVMHVDEYDPRARKDTLQLAAQLLKYCYTAQELQKGGMQEGSWAKLTTLYTHAPVVVSGEDVMGEGAHIERMIRLNMDARKQNVRAFEAVQENESSGFTYAYLSWLQAKIKKGEFANLKIEPKGPAGLARRQRYNLGVLDFGWNLLGEFMSEFNDSLDPGDFSAVAQAMGEANKHTPIEEAIKWCLDEVGAEDFVKYIEGEVWVYPEGLYMYLQHPQRAALFSFPERPAAIRHYMVTMLNAREERRGRRSFMVVPYSVLRGE